MTPETRTWSIELRQQTRNFILEMQTSPFDAKLHFKNHDDRFAALTCRDLLSGNLALVEQQTDQVLVFANVDALLDAGWVID